MIVTIKSLLNTSIVQYLYFLRIIIKKIEFFSGLKRNEKKSKIGLGNLYILFVI